MRRHHLIASLAAAALIPSIAAAQQTCAEQRSGRVAGTLAGAGIGALLGSAVAGHGDKGTGAVIGAVGGGIIGNQVSKPKTDCIDSYGYYDHNGIWHANAVRSRNAVGYYDPKGRGACTGPSAGGYGRDVAYEARDIWAGAPLDIRQRESWLEQRTRRGMDDGSLNRFEATRALRELFQIRREEASLRRGDGMLRRRDRDYIQAKLHTLSRNIRWMRNNDERRY